MMKGRKKINNQIHKAHLYPTSHCRSARTLWNTSVRLVRLSVHKKNLHHYYTGRYDILIIIGYRLDLYSPWTPTSPDTPLALGWIGLKFESKEEGAKGCSSLLLTLNLKITIWNKCCDSCVWMIIFHFLPYNGLIHQAERNTPPPIHYQLFHRQYRNI